MKWLYVAEAYGGCYGMPMFVWTLFLVCFVCVCVVCSFCRGDGNRFSERGALLILLFSVVWSIHAFVVYYTIVNLFAFRHYTSFLGMKAAEHERLYFDLLNSLLQMGLVSTTLLIVLSFAVCLRSHTRPTQQGHGGK